MTNKQQQGDEYNPEMVERLLELDKQPGERVSRDDLDEIIQSPPTEAAPMGDEAGISPETKFSANANSLYARNPAPHAAAPLSPSPFKSFVIQSSPTEAAPMVSGSACTCYLPNGPALPIGKATCPVHSPQATRGRLCKELRSFRPTYGWPEEIGTIVKTPLNERAASLIERQAAELKEAQKGWTDERERRWSWESSANYVGKLIVKREAELKEAQAEIERLTRDRERLADAGEIDELLFELRATQSNPECQGQTKEIGRLRKAQERLNRALSLLEQCMGEMTVKESKIWAAETNELLAECRDDTIPDGRIDLND